MNQATIRALSQVGELVKEENTIPDRNSSGRILLSGILLWDEVRDKRFA